MNATLSAIGSESSLAVLGLSPGNLVSLGNMIQWARGYNAVLAKRWLWIGSPIVATVILFVGLFMLITGYNDYQAKKRQVIGMLKIENLSTSYKTIDGDVHVLKDINFEIKDNEIFGIAGESGCGKTTLLNTLYDIVDYPLVIDQGRVVLEGEKTERNIHSNLKDS